jgi:hypothetical protein
MNKLLLKHREELDLFQCRVTQLSEDTPPKQNPSSPPRLSPPPMNKCSTVSYTPRTDPPLTSPPPSPLSALITVSSYCLVLNPLSTASTACHQQSLRN